MESTVQEQIKNAIQWIETLPNYKQAPKGYRGKLGDKKHGFCCLGAGCYELGVEFDFNQTTSIPFQEKVGLKGEVGDLTDSKSIKRFYKWGSLTEINDKTNAGFKRIANLLKTHPEWMFMPKVAKGIRDHYKNSLNLRIIQRKTKHLCWCFPIGRTLTQWLQSTILS